ncbi:LPS assembly lipoprotein LptE [uncultured Pseudacidovorax sp.]|uniref:LPS-assembly lipoprotein LptE n=1 Tax=uncultured Pseudacidovorax sp. TaxID=679313 RepID=UPI0025CCF69A|nr:LPS assembly lipoprotein LptE [uncultured Pseudacidovorax sp.]
MTPGARASAQAQGMATGHARRRLLAAAATLPVAALLAGCGFRMRGAVQFPFRSIAVTGVPGVAAELRRALRGQGDLKVLANTDPVGEAEAVCDLSDEARTSAILSTTSTGQARDLSITLRVSYRLRTRDGRELIPKTPITLSRDISYNENTVLAKEAEQNFLYRDMMQDMAQQLVRRLAAAKLPAAS